ncbi:hypothetical protein C7T35_27675 [Variovorax sp. WS11]|uniref:NAD(P)-binding domain-containing protein n=1 Tax=Variovorax sp. WS11 TaxID=1105204 RepID=UPI000D0D389A|nr:NAD(P)-binding domain-containing protein [Variovorax sp. WS11]NDZ16907.1 hypothetical protein [Variovorax sp. WS11]PSL81324.1 hypothetical protein C7T35_27675 [Variovorax sp. WS11]
MEIGMIGLGKMGKMGMSMAQRLQRDGHRVVGFARSAGTRARAQGQGIEPADSIEALVHHVLQPPRALRMMVPAGEVVDQTIAILSPLLSRGDTIIDGGNSNYKDTLRRGKSLSETEIDYIDCGTSGGILGVKQGYSLMIGGDEKATNQLRPLFTALLHDPQPC